MEIELAGAFVVALVTMAYCVKLFANIIGNKLESIFKAINKQGEALEGLTEELKNGHRVLDKHMRDTQMHTTLDEKKTLSDLKV